MVDVVLFPGRCTACSKTLSYINSVRVYQTANWEEASIDVFRNSLITIPITKDCAIQAQKDIMEGAKEDDLSARSLAHSLASAALGLSDSFQTVVQYKETMKYMKCTSQDSNGKPIIEESCFRKLALCSCSEGRELIPKPTLLKAMSNTPLVEVAAVTVEKKHTTAATPANQITGARDALDQMRKTVNALNLDFNFDSVVTEDAKMLIQQKFGLSATVDTLPQPLKDSLNRMIKDHRSINSSVLEQAVAQISWRSPQSIQKSMFKPNEWLEIATKQGFSESINEVPDFVKTVLCAHKDVKKAKELLKTIQISADTTDKLVPNLAQAWASVSNAIEGDATAVQQWSKLGGKKSPPKAFSTFCKKDGVRACFEKHPGFINMRNWKQLAETGFNTYPAYIAKMNGLTGELDASPDNEKQSQYFKGSKGHKTYHLVAWVLALLKRNPKARIGLQAKLVNGTLVEKSTGVFTANGGNPPANGNNNKTTDAGKASNNSRGKKNGNPGNKGKNGKRQPNKGKQQSQNPVVPQGNKGAMDKLLQLLQMLT